MREFELFFLFFSQIYEEVPEKVCQKVPKETCKTKYRKKCDKIPKQVCKTKYRYYRILYVFLSKQWEILSTFPCRKHCEKKPKKVCRTEYKKKCIDEPYSVKMRKEHH